MYIISLKIKLLVQQLKTQVVFLTETKIDSSYANAQFNLGGFNIYRQDRSKGGVGIMTFFAFSLVSTRLKSPKKFETIESLVIKSKFGNSDITVVGLCRLPKTVSGNYAVQLENELNDIVFNWRPCKLTF